MRQDVRLGQIQKDRLAVLCSGLAWCVLVVSVGSDSLLWARSSQMSAELPPSLPLQNSARPRLGVVRGSGSGSATLRLRLGKLTSSGEELLLMFS